MFSIVVYTRNECVLFVGRLKVELGISRISHWSRAKKKHIIKRVKRKVDDDEAMEEEALENDVKKLSKNSKYI